MRRVVFILFLLGYLIFVPQVRAQSWLLSIPSTFPKFFSSNSANDTLLNDFFYRHFSAMVGPSGNGQTEWREWDALITTWIDTNTNKVMSNRCNIIGSSCSSGPPCSPCYPFDYNSELRWNLLEVKVEDNGLVWTYWNTGRDWPTTGGHHPTNNTALIIASARYFNWTGDTDFLKLQIPRMRKALRYLQVDLNGDQFNLIENRRSGQDGLDKSLSSNYWDALPFGFRDAYATVYYYAALRDMAEMEAFIESHPSLGIPTNPYGENASSYRQKAENVRNFANVFFWNDPTWPGGAAPKNLSKGRLAATIDIRGVVHDYGYTFLNLEAIYKGFLNDTQSKAVFSWLTGDGKNEFNADRSRAADIYSYIFAPRVSTKHNGDWYLQWAGFLKDSSTFGRDSGLQNGGGDLFVSFYDIMGRIKYLGTANAYSRLSQILSWYNTVWSNGGYRKYYPGVGYGLQGCEPKPGENNLGNMGIDCEFTESTLVPLAFLYGFLGIEAKTDVLHIEHALPTELTYAGVDNLYWQGKLYKITASRAISQPSYNFINGKNEITIPYNYLLIIPFGSNIPTVSPTPCPFHGTAKVKDQNGQIITIDNFSIRSVVRKPGETEPISDKIVPFDL
jgi:hypothetical protein